MRPVNLKPFYCPICAGRNLRRPCRGRVVCCVRYTVRTMFHPPMLSGFKFHVNDR